MIIKNLIILGIALTAILAYVVRIPSSISAEYSKSKHYTAQINECGIGPSFFSSNYESFADNVYCSNTGSQLQGKENSVGNAST